MAVASALSWKSVLVRASAPSIEELLIMVMISSIVELPKCMFRDKGDINVFLSSTNLPNPLYSNRSASITEVSPEAVCQRRYFVLSCHRTLCNGFMSEMVMSHQVILKKRRKGSIAGEQVDEGVTQVVPPLTRLLAFKRPVVKGKIFGDGRDVDNRPKGKAHWIPNINL